MAFPFPKIGLPYDHPNNVNIVDVGMEDAFLDAKDGEVEQQVKMVDNRIMQEQLNQKAAQIEELSQKVKELTVANEQLEAHNQKLAEESSYSKGLASAAAAEKKSLSEEVAKLMDKNVRLTADLATSKHSPGQRRGSIPSRNGKRDGLVKRNNQGESQADIQEELTMSQEGEYSYEAALSAKERREAEWQKKMEELKHGEACLETGFDNMWSLNSQHHTERRILEGETLMSRGRKDFRDEYEDLLPQKQESLKIKEQINLPREQQKNLSGEGSLHSTALKRSPEEVAQNPENEQTNVEIRRLNDEIMVKSPENQTADLPFASCYTGDTSERFLDWSFVYVDENRYCVRCKLDDDVLVHLPTGRDLVDHMTDTHRNVQSTLLNSCLGPLNCRSP